ncbi:MAG: type II secretion system protein GspG, partial [Anaerolineales bacterium]|nr:type II secretion system protein GspG [Anaerolineales bacterium]
PDRKSFLKAVEDGNFSYENKFGIESAVYRNDRGKITFEFSKDPETGEYKVKDVDVLLSKRGDTVKTSDPPTSGTKENVPVKYQMAETDIKRIVSIIDAYYAQRMRHPETHTEAVEISGETLPSTDPWGRPWEYRTQDEGFYIGSKGEDVATEDDDIFYDSEEGRIINMKDGGRRTELKSESNSLRVTLDAQQLAKFVQSLRLAAENKRALIRGTAPQGKTFADLIIELYQTKVLTVEDIGYLAGASGTKATEEQLKSGKLDPQTNIIFTGPNTGAKLLELLNGGGTYDVLLCYNRHHYNRYPDSGMVVLFAGGTTPSVMSLKNIAANYWAVSGERLSFDFELAGKDASFYGKPPFQNVVPE